MQITADQFKQLAYQNMPDALVHTWAEKLGAALVASHIDTPLRAGHFFAQAMQESGRFLYTEELWGPTQQQLKYDPASGSDLSRNLGNTHPGDGYLFRGRGVFETTGRGNYHLTGQRLGLDLEAHPEYMAQIGVGSLGACDFWTHHGLSALADRGGLPMVTPITRLVNGGYTGLSERQRYYSLAARLFGAP